MKLRRTTAALGALLATLIVSGPARATVPQSFTEKKAEALSKNVPLLIKFGAEWCGPCKRFTADTGTNAELQKMLEPVVLCDIDAEKEDGVALAKTYEIVGFPTFILVNDKGETIDRWTGYGTPAEFGPVLAAGLADPTPLAARETRFKEKPTATDAENLGRARSSKGDYAGAVEYYTKARELNPEKAADYTESIYLAQYSGLRKEVFTIDDLTKTADEILASGKADAEDLAMVAMTMTSTARNAGKPETAAPYLKAAYEATKDATDPDLASTAKSLAVDYAMIVEKDAVKAVELKKATMPEKWTEDAGELNGFAWWCFENRVNLDEALTYARKGIELAKPGKEKGMILDTAAEICLAKGGCKDAVELAEQALQNDPDNKYYKKQLERFQKELAAVEEKK